MEEATTQALSGSLFLLVTASQFCVAPAGQTKLRSGGLREGWLTHVGGCAPCCRPRTRPWRRRFAISLAQVVLAFRCGGSRELLTNSDELEGLLIQAASAQTAGPIKYATKAVRPGVLLVCASAFGSADCGLCPGRAAANERGGSSQNRKQMCSANGKRTGKHPCARQDLARRVQEVAIKQLETAQQAVTTAQQAVTTAQQAVTTAQEVVGRLTTLWLAERPSGSEKANLLKQELNEAQQNYGMAQQKYAEAQQKYEEAQQNCKAASASIQAGRVQAGASACAVVAVAFDLHSRTVVVSVRSTVFCFLGSCSHLGKDPVVVKLSPLRSLGAFRSGGALGCFRFHKKLWLHLFYRVEKAPLWLRQRCYANLFAPRVFADA